MANKFSSTLLVSNNSIDEIRKADLDLLKKINALYVEVDALIVDITDINSGYYTKAEIDTILTNYYTKAQVDAMFSNLMDDYYTKTEINTILTNYYTETEVNNLLSAKVNNSEVSVPNVINTIPKRDASGKIFVSEVNANNKLLANALDIVKDPTGFKEPESVVVSYDQATKRITLTGSVEAYWRGELVSALVSGWTSEPIPVATPVNPYFLYYNGTGFIWSTNVWEFDYIQIAYVYYSPAGAFFFAQRECHGCAMNYTDHREMHFLLGTWLFSGGDLSGYTLNSTTATNRRPAISQTKIYDEDLLTINASQLGTNYSQLYLTSTGISTIDINQPEFLKLSGDRPYYNQFNGTNWVQTLASNNNYISFWLITLPASADSASQSYRYLWLQGQSQGTLAQQQSIVFAQLNLGTFMNIAPEMVAISKVIVHYTAANWSIVQVDKLTGSRTNSFQTPAGNFLTAVSTTGIGLQGNGTAGNPLELTNKFQSASGTITLMPQNETGDFLLVLPAITDYLVSRNSVDTLTNKTIGGLLNFTNGNTNISENAGDIILNANNSDGNINIQAKYLRFNSTTGSDLLIGSTAGTGADILTIDSYGAIDRGGAIYVEAIGNGVGKDGFFRVICDSDETGKGGRIQLNARSKGIYPGKLELLATTILAGNALATTTFSGNFIVKKDITNDINDINIAQLMIQGATSTNKRMALGYDTTDNYGYIEAGEYGVAWRPLCLQPTNGTTQACVLVGKTSQYSSAYKMEIEGGLYVNGVITATGNITGNLIGKSDSTDLLKCNDNISGNPNNINPNTNHMAIRADFVSNAYVLGSGSNYAGVITFNPWTGETISYGDASYQLGFTSTATNGSGTPKLLIRNGIDTTWNSWKTIAFDDTDGWIDWSSSCTTSGFESTYQKQLFYKIINNKTIHINVFIEGYSDNYNFTCTTPYAPKSGGVVYIGNSCPYAIDAGAAVVSSSAIIQNGLTVINFYKNMNYIGWSISGIKGAMVSLTYEIA